VDTKVLLKLTPVDSLFVRPHSTEIPPLVYPLLTVRIPGLMLHLDRNHHPSPLSPHANSNLILPTDQFKLLSRSPLAHDDKPAHQNTTVDLDATDTPTGEQVVAKQPTPPPPVDGPVESHSPAETHSPTAPTPNGHRSSSLSPPPHSGSPGPTAATSPLVLSEEPIEEPAPEPAEPSNAVPAEEPVAEEEAASPLSELSPAPEQEESFEDDKEDNTDLATSPAEVEEAEMTAEVTEIPAETEKIEAVETTEFKKEDNSTIPSEHTSPAAIPPQSPDAAPTPVPESESKTTSTSDPMSTDPTPNGDQSAVSKSKTAAAKSPAKSPAPESSSSQEPRAASRRPSTSTSSSSGPLEPSKNKAERLLELNEELLKFVMLLFQFEQYFDSLCNRVCIEFQAHGIPMNELRFQEWVTFTQFDIF